MPEPLISVALCTYNGAKYIKEQLDSITCQTYRNLEIMIVDDGSSDGTLEIIKVYAAKDSRVRCFQNSLNLGFNKNFEKAIGLTSGDYIAISDQDDIWLPNKLQTLLDNINGNWLIFSNSCFIGTTENKGRLLNHFRLPDDFKGILLCNFVTGHTALINREFLKYVLPFPQKGYYDWWMGFVAAYHHKLAFTDQVLTCYRVHHESVIQQRTEFGKAKLEEYGTVGIMLNNFSGYKNLSVQDKKFIDQLQYGYQLKGSRSWSLPLIKLVYEYYKELFPNSKPRRSLSKLNFAFKFSKKVRT